MALRTCMGKCDANFIISIASYLASDYQESTFDPPPPPGPTQSILGSDRLIPHKTRGGSTRTVIISIGNGPIRKLAEANSHVLFIYTRYSSSYWVPWSEDQGECIVAGVYKKYARIYPFIYSSPVPNHRIIRVLPLKTLYNS